MIPVQEITFDVYQQSQDKDWEVIDVREKWEYDIVHLPEARNISLAEIMQDRDVAAKNIDWKKQVLFVCRSGGRSMQAALLMGTRGEHIYNLTGGTLEVYQRFPNYVVGDKKDIDQYFG